MKGGVWGVLWLSAVGLWGGLLAGACVAHERPNIVFIMADDLGYGDLGCYGQELIQTPHLDQMASEGLRCLDFYAGSTVCAPSRCVLMTGLHTGHCRVRGNGSPVEQSLTADDVTVATLLQRSGYTTAMIGKWGLGEPGDAASGLPGRQGFDEFFGYLNQHHAHNYYPEYLWRNEEQVPLRNVVTVMKADPSGNAGYATDRQEYSGDLFFEEAVSFLSRPHTQPFFLYLPVTAPHGNNERTKALRDGAEVPDYGPYANRDWTDPTKGQAAMITRMDAGVGRVMATLRERGLEDNTVVFFTSDNGPHNESGHTVSVFNPAGPLRGMKRDMYEGGIRVPMIVRWPGHVAAGKLTSHVGYFGDFLPTACALAGIPAPAGLDGISLVPLLTGTGVQPAHDHLYWEFYEQGSKQAVRKGDWKAIRMPMQTGKVELYDLSSDLHEENNVAADHPDVVKEMIRLMDAEHVPSELWKPRGQLPGR